MGLDYHLGFKKTIFSIFQFFRSLGDILAKKTVISRNTKLAGFSDGKKTFFQKPTSWRGKNHFFTEIFFPLYFSESLQTFLEKLFSPSGHYFWPKNGLQKCNLQKISKNVTNAQISAILDIFSKKIGHSTFPDHFSVKDNALMAKTNFSSKVCKSSEKYEEKRFLVKK